MKKISRIIAAIAALTLVIGSFAGCGESGSQKRKKFSGTLSYWVNMDGNTTNAGLEDNSEMMLYKEMEKRTGIKIDFIHPAAGSVGNEAFTTLLLDEELPDIIKYGWDAYPGGPEQAIADQVIIALDQEVDLAKVAPGYWRYVNDDPENVERKKAVTTEDGHYYGFNNLNLGETKGFAGIFVRKDLLDKWGLAIPETIDDWDNVFATAKSNGVKEPFTCGLSYLSFKGNSVYGFMGAYGVGSGYYIDDVDGKAQVVFAPNQEGYSDYVAKLQEWYKKGYIDKDIATVASDLINQKMVDGTSIASIGYIGSSMGKILPAAKARYGDEYSIVACPFPKNIYTGADSEFQGCYNAATGTANAITWQCGDYDAAASWCDYVYTDEGMVLQLFGIEGTHHTVEMFDYDGDGVEEKHYVYTDLIAKPENSNCNTVAEAMYKYMLPCNYPGYNQHIDYLLGYYQEPEQKDAIKLWNVPAQVEGTEADDPDSIDTPLEHQLPTLSFTPEENEEVNELRTLVESTLEASLIDAIMGKKTIAQWEKDVETANKNGYKRLLEIYNASYSRYLSK